MRTLSTPAVIQILLAHILNIHAWYLLLKPSSKKSANGGCSTWSLPQGITFVFMVPTRIFITCVLIIIEEPLIVFKKCRTALKNNVFFLNLGDYTLYNTCRECIFYNCSHYPQYITFCTSALVYTLMQALYTTLHYITPYAKFGHIKLMVCITVDIVTHVKTELGVKSCDPIPGLFHCICVKVSTAIADWRFGGLTSSLRPEF